MHALRTAIEVGDIAAIEPLLADDVVFSSPIVFKPYPGKGITLAFLRAVVGLFEDFRYVREIADAAGHDHALIFETRIGDTKINGCDFVHVNADGKIDSFMVMVRPLTAAKALQQAMAPQIEGIQREALEYAHSEGIGA